MKTRKRTYPLDMLAIEKRSLRIVIFRQREKVVLTAGGGFHDIASREFTFDELFDLIRALPEKEQK